MRQPVLQVIGGRTWTITLCFYCLIASYWTWFRLLQRQHPNFLCWRRVFHNV